MLSSVAEPSRLSLILQSQAYQDYSLSQSLSLHCLLAPRVGFPVSSCQDLTSCPFGCFSVMTSTMVSPNTSQSGLKPVSRSCHRIETNQHIRQFLDNCCDLSVILGEISRCQYCIENSRDMDPQVSKALTWTNWEPNSRPKQASRNERDWENESPLRLM